MTTPFTKQSDWAPANGKRAAIGQDPASSSSNAPMDPIAALRMPRKAAPTAPTLPSWMSGDPPANPATASGGTAEAKAHPETSASPTGVAGGSSADRRDSVSVALLEGSVPATEVAVAGAGPAASSYSASASPLAAAVLEADQQSTTVPTTGDSETTLPNGSLAAPHAAAVFSFKRAPRKSPKSSFAADSEGVAAETTASSSTAAQNTSSFEPAAVMQNSNHSTQLADLNPSFKGAPLLSTKPLPPPEDDSKTNGHQEVKSVPQKNSAAQADVAAMQEQPPSGPPAGAKQQQSSALMEGIVPQPSSPPAGHQVQQASVPMEGIVQQPSAPSAGGKVPSSDPSTLLTTQAAPSSVQPSSDATATVAATNTTTKSTSISEGPSRPGAAAEGPGSPATPQKLPQTPTPPTPENKQSTEQSSTRTVSALSRAEPSAQSKDSPMQEGDGEAPSVLARVQGVKRSSDPPSVETPQPVARRGSFRWQVTTPTTMPEGSRGTGQVVEESCKPRDKLKGFWEEQGPTSNKGATLMRDLPSSAGNEGKKWAVKLNQPLANGKLSDLSYFRSKSVSATPPPPPPTFDINIGDAYYPLLDLQEMSGKDGIDPSQKELYLSDDVFEEAFGFDKASFGSKPKWRQVLLKKKVKLF